MARRMHLRQQAAGNCSSLEQLAVPALWRMLNSSVREALLTSVAWRRPLVSFQSSQQSMVPKASSPVRRATARRAHGRAASAAWCPRSRGRCTRPVRAATAARGPRARSCAHSGSVRRSCQTMALCDGCAGARGPTARVVSRWLVMPMAAMSLAFRPAWPVPRARPRAAVPDLVGVVLDPAGLRIDLAEFTLRHRDDAAAGVKHDGA